jgi:hypothetical protein
MPGGCHLKLCRVLRFGRIEVPVGKKKKGSLGGVAYACHPIKGGKLKKKDPPGWQGQKVRFFSISKITRE